MHCNLFYCLHNFIQGYSYVITRAYLYKKWYVSNSEEDERSLKRDDDRLKSHMSNVLNSKENEEIIISLIKPQNVIILKRLICTIFFG